MRYKSIRTMFLDLKCELNSKENKKRVAEDSLDGKTKPLLNTHCIKRIFSYSRMYAECMQNACKSMSLYAVP